MDSRFRTLFVFFSIFTLTISSPVVPNPQPGPAPSVAPLNFIPIISSEVCAVPPGNIATDGCDDVCLLVACCDGWKVKPNSSPVKLQNNETVNCSAVNCGNVCRMACDREPTGESCSDTCEAPPFFTGRAYVFSRIGTCSSPFLQYPFINFKSPTHVGFGFEVSPGIFLFGSVENSIGDIYVPAGSDNGFWMATGTHLEMLATFKNPAASKFHGALGAKPYDQYRMSRVGSPAICAAVGFAESLYSVGYSAVGGNNCLDAVYNVLTVYGSRFPPGVDPADIWCPSGPYGWFSALHSPEWSRPRDIPATGSPVVAVSCPTTVPATCASSSSPPNQGGSCAGLNFANCLSCNLAPTCFFIGFDEIGGATMDQCPTSCAQANPCLCNAACNDGKGCLFYNQ
jgi:hypothetical protein